LSRHGYLRRILRLAIVIEKKKRKKAIDSQEHIACFETEIPNGERTEQNMTTALQALLLQIAEFEKRLQTL